MSDAQLNKENSSKNDSPQHRGGRWLRLILLLFVIILAARLFIPGVFAFLAAGPLLIGLPIMFLFCMFAGVLIAVFFTAFGLIFCGFIILAILLVLSSMLSVFWPVAVLAAIFVLLLLFSRRHRGLHESD